MKKQAGLLLFFLIFIFRGFAQESEPLQGIGIYSKYRLHNSVSIFKLTTKETRNTMNQCQYLLNIYFGHRLSVLRFGLMTETLRF